MSQVNCARFIQNCTSEECSTEDNRVQLVTLCNILVVQQIRFRPGRSAELGRLPGFLHVLQQLASAGGVVESECEEDRQ